MEADKRGAGRTAGVAGLAMLVAAMGGNFGASAQVYSVALPDISNKTLTVRPGRVTAGADVEIINALQNRGEGDLVPRYRPPPPAVGGDTPDLPLAPAPPTLTVRFILVENVKNGFGVDAGSWGLDALERRGVKSHTSVWTVPVTTTPGLWFLCADVDPGNEVRESNEHNNRTCYPLTVEPPAETALDMPDEEGESDEDFAAGDGDPDPGFSGLTGGDAPTPN